MEQENPLTVSTLDSVVSTHFNNKFFLKKDQTFSPFAAERVVSFANDGPLTCKSFNSADEAAKQPVMSQFCIFCVHNGLVGTKVAFVLEVGR